MATGPVVNQGKTAFVEAHLTDHPDANPEAINRSWTAAGNDGAVSDSLVAKVRARLGLTGKKPADQPTPAPPSKQNARPSAPTQPRKRTEGPDKSGPAANGSTPKPTPRSDEEDDLDELEEAIDELIHRLRVIGGRTDVVKALRRARRLLVRGVEE